MHIPPNKLKKESSLSRLVQLWGLTQQNTVLAWNYLMEETADDSLLSGTERQIFTPFDWYDRQEICAVLQELTAPEPTKDQAKVLKLLWAIGRSTAIFAALFDSHDSNSDDAFRWYSEVLGLAAAVAMDAEYLAAHPISYDPTKRLHPLARTNPDALMEAQKRIADPQNSMAAGMLAGVLLAAWPEEAKADTQPAQQVELLLDRVEAILTSQDNILFSAEDVSQLKAYLRTGDPTAPVPATSVSNAWQLSAPDCLSQLLISPLSSSVECIAPAVLFALHHDPRLACAMRILTGVNLHGALWGILCLLPENRELDVLDTLLPYIPGGTVTLLLFAVKDFYESAHKETAQKLARHFRAGADEAIGYMDLEGYQRLGNLLPEVKHSRDKDWMDHLQVVIMSYMRKIFSETPAHTIVRDYLDSRGAFSDSVALLKPVRNEDRYLLNIDQALVEYRKIAGWDAFACRCIVLFCLTCTGYGTSSSFPPDKDQKQNMDAFVNALIANGLPVQDCLTVLAIMYDNWCEEESKNLLKAAVQKHFVTPERIEGLSNAALNSPVTARIMAIEGLDKLSALPECAEKARKFLISCAGDTSKQVREILAERYIRHPDWEKDYLALLGSKKTARRSLAIQVLAGIGAEKYRSALEHALAQEKNAKVMDQITAVLGTSAAVGTGKQTPEELAAQVLMGGKKRKVQWLLEQSLPTVHRTDEARTVASEDQIAALFVSYADLGRIGRSDTAAAIAADLDEKDLKTLACTVWERWIQAEAPGKTKWVLPFAAVFGGAAMTPELIRAIHEWPQNARGAIACDAVAALSVSSDPAALMAVDGISRKFKFRQIKTAAAAALEKAAQELNITTEELADRIVPTLDFAPDGTRVFDYGPRKFIVRLTPSLKLAVTTETGKEIKSIPTPGKTDDEKKAPPLMKNTRI